MKKMKKQKIESNEEKGPLKKPLEPEDNFFYEVRSTTANLSKIEDPADAFVDSSEPQKRKPIKILSERDIEIRVIPPPNYSQYFLCFLHYKNRPYKSGRLLNTKGPSKEQM